jgi:pimeloyl-ACP methyl ester carboxylesterase
MMGSGTRYSDLFNVDGVEDDFIHLRTKASARLSYSFGDPTKRPTRLLVFLSGLDVPKTLWKGTVKSLLKTSESSCLDLPPMLLYDRFGVGATTDQDPSDAGKAPEQRHDVMEAVRDLRQLIIQISEAHLGYAEHEIDQLHLEFAAHSIGCCVGRLYAQNFPGTVNALLLIDSAIANTPIQNFIPNPEIPEEFDKLNLPKGVNIDSCRHAIKALGNTPFSAQFPIRERLRWTNLPSLLPFNDAPRLVGSSPGLPLVTVLCHDPEVFYMIALKVSRKYIGRVLRLDSTCLLF